jgi:hypothetical protein
MGGRGGGRRGQMPGGSLGGMQCCALHPRAALGGSMGIRGWPCWGRRATWSAGVEHPPGARCLGKPAQRAVGYNALGNPAHAALHRPRAPLPGPRCLSEPARGGRAGAHRARRAAP